MCLRTINLNMQHAFAISEAYAVCAKLRATKTRFVTPLERSKQMLQFITVSLAKRPSPIGVVLRKCVVWYLRGSPRL